MTQLSTRDIGRLGEEIALRYLKQLGLLIQDTNFHVKGGEIDIIALEGSILSFIEVKYRRNAKFGSPLEAISFTKQKRMRKGAEVYLLNHTHQGAMRFDVLGITDIKGTTPQYEYIRNAF